MNSLKEEPSTNPDRGAVGSVTMSTRFTILAATSQSTDVEYWDERPLLAILPYWNFRLSFISCDIMLFHARSVRTTVSEEPACLDISPMRLSLSPL